MMSAALRAAQGAIAAFAIALCATPASAAPAVLLDQAGHAFTLQNLRGAPLVVTFVAARCTDACPLINAQIAAATSDPRLTGVRFLTISLDPRHDTVAAMRTLSNRFGAHTPQWTFATGAVANVQAVMRLFDVVAVANTGGIPEMHTTFVYLVNPAGHIVRALLPSGDTSSEIAGALAR